MDGDISVRKAIGLTDALFIDLRSPKEYTQGSIPGAINIPLFNDEEREIIGLLYKEDQHKARMKALAFITPKLPVLIETIKELGTNRTPVLYCWRGGMRSKSIHALLDIMDVPAYRLEGGYKSYRRFILDQFKGYNLNKTVFVLNGLTGSGKTEVLHHLEEMGCPTIDLENLAQHRGSLFGHLGIDKLRSQKDFDALLWSRLEELKGAEYLIIEGEGKRIGPAYQPDFLFKAIQEGKHILLTAPLENRVERLLREYTPTSPDEKNKVKGAIVPLQKYLGGETVRRLLSLLEEENYQELVSELCTKYYDNLYSESKPGKTTKFELIIDSSNPIKAAKEIKEFVKGELQGEYLRPCSRPGKSN